MLYVVALIMMFVGFVNVHDYPFFNICLILAGGVLFWLRIEEGKKKAKWKKDWEEFSDGAEYLHYYDHTGIWLSPQSKGVGVMVKGVSKIYPFDDVRSWRYNIATGGEITAIGNVGVAGASRMVNHNMAVASANKRNTGFWVTVRDVDRPEWRIAFPASPPALKRWMEIFEQNVNEAT